MPESVQSCFELSIHFPVFFSDKLFLVVQLNLSTTATLGTEESGCCGEVAVMGR